MVNRKLFILLFVLMLTLMGCSDSSSPAKGDSKEKSALNYPTKPIKFIAPYAAGGITDIMARGIAEYAPKYLGESLVVENIPGAAGVVGVTEGVNAKNDGYTMTLAAGGVFTSVPHTSTLTFELDDMEALVSFQTAANILIVKDDSPYQTVKDLVDATNSGENLIYGNSGARNLPHLAIETFFAELKGEHSHVPYEGSAPVIAAILGGHINVGVVHPTDVKSHLEAGSVKVLGVFGPERLANYPETPTVGESFKEVGIEYPYASNDFAVWMFGLVPAGTPPEIIDYLTVGLKEMLNDKEFIEFTEKTDLTMDLIEGEEVKKRLQQENEVYGKIINELEI